MVVFQFTTSIVLIIGTFVVYRQMSFIMHTKIGYDKDQVIMIQGANIFRLLTRSFVLLVIVSFVIALPLGWYLMTTWLADYNYKIDITWDVFAIAGAAAVLIALITVSYQSVKVALTNPADNLRPE